MLVKASVCHHDPPNNTQLKDLKRIWTSRRAKVIVDQKAKWTRKCPHKITFPHSIRTWASVSGLEVNIHTDVVMGLSKAFCSCQN